MAHAVDFVGRNTLLEPALGTEHNVSVLPIFRNGLCCVSAWKLSAEELEAIINNDGVMYVTVLSGHTQPPVYVGSEATVREVVADLGGVWKKG